MHQVDLSKIDLNLLIGLDVLLDTGSVTAAASRLRRSQPAVSRILARLRALLDDDVLVKEGRGLVPTPRALALREPLKLALSEVRGVLHPPSPFDPASVKRHFRLLSSDYAHIVLLGRVVEELRRIAPGVTILVDAIPSNLLQILAEGAADLVLAPPEACPPWAESQPLLRDPWMCVRRKGETPPRSVNDYLSLEHIDVETEQRFGRPIATAVQALGGQRRVRLQVSDFSGALLVVAQSDLVATVPRPVAQSAVTLLPVEAAPLPFEVPSPTISMIWPRRLTKDPAHSWLRAQVRRAVK